MRILLWFELGALIVCLARFRELKKNPVLKWFLLLLFVTNAVEWGSYFRVFTIHLANGKKTSNWIYNIFNPLEYGFFAYYYHSILDSAKRKKRIEWFYLFFLVLVVINVLAVQGWMYLDSYTYIVGCAFLVWLSTLYFKQLAQNVEETDLLTSPYFWINVGVLLFYAGDFFLFIFFAYFLETNSFAVFVPAWLFFSNFLNIILYTCLSIAFFCSPTSQKISLSES